MKNYFTKNTTKIVEIIEENPQISRQELAGVLDLTLYGVDWHLRKLRENGTIKREGSSRNGKWVVIKK
jgi:ATP-dependent DNA helicase RecG